MVGLAGENKPAIVIQPGDRLEPELCLSLLKVGAIALQQGDRIERAVGLIGPGMIRACEKPGIPRRLCAHLGPAMGAAVVESVPRAVAMARDNNPVAANSRREEIACAGELTVMANIDPGAPKNAAHFKVEDV